MVAPDCARAWTVHDQRMAHLPPLALSPEDNLDILCHLDEFRFWHSLDDQRHCGRCDEIIAGRQILVLECPGTRGRMRLQCPTPGCASAPGDWAYVDPVRFATFKPSTPGLSCAVQENVSQPATSPN